RVARRHGARHAARSRHARDGQGRTGRTGWTGRRYVADVRAGNGSRRGDRSPRRDVFRGECRYWPSLYDRAARCDHWFIESTMPNQVSPIRSTLGLNGVPTPPPRSKPSLVSEAEALVAGKGPNAGTVTSSLRK